MRASALARTRGLSITPVTKRDAYAWCQRASGATPAVTVCNHIT